MTKKRTKADKLWPPIYRHVNRTGSITYQVDLGINPETGKRDRPGFDSEQLAQAYREQCRISRDNEGLKFFAVPIDVKLEAATLPQ